MNEENKIKELERKLSNATLFHAITLNREEVQVEDRYIRNVSFSSNLPIQHWFGFLILDHDPLSIRMNRWQMSPAFLDNHDKDKQRGAIVNTQVRDNAKLVGDVFFSQSAEAQQLKQDMDDGIRPHTSLGFLVHGKIEFELDQAGNKVSIGEEDVYRCKDWEPLEGSSVSVPADISVGIGRALYEDRNSEILKKEIEQLRSEIKININKTKEADMPELNEKTPQEILAEERTRVAEVTALAKRHNLDPSDAIKNGTSIEAYRGIVLQAIGDSKPLDKDPNQLDLNEKEKKDYSFLRLLRTQIPGDKLYGARTFETELSEQLAKNLGEKPKGAYVPYDALSKTRMKRDLTAGGTGTGAEWVSKVWYGSEFIELLRNKMVLQAHGAQVWSGLTGNVYVPKLSVGATYGWRSTETGNTSESTPTTAQLSLTPKSGGTYVDLSKALLLQGNPDVESTITNDIIKACAIGLDTAGLVGSGASGQPTGIALTSGIGSFNGAAIAYTDLIEALTDVESANADVPNMAFLTTPTVRGVLKGRPKETGGATGYLCSENNIALGYPCDITNSITAGYLFFGDYSQVIIATWGGIDVLVDPYGSLAIAGLVRVHVDQYADIGVRQAGAFSLATGVS